MTVTLTPITATPTPAFDERAASVVYKAMCELDDDAALAFGRILLAESLDYDRRAHFTEVADGAAARLGAVRKNLAVSAVAKARRGEDNEIDIAALVGLAKASPFGTSEDLSRRAKRRRRDAGGRFADEYRRIDTDEGVAPRRGHHAAASGLPRPTEGMSDRDRAHFQQAYQQIRDLVAPYQDNNLHAVLHLGIRDANGAEKARTLPIRDGRPPDMSGTIAPGERIRSASVTVNPTPGAGTAAFEALSALGSPRAGGHAANLYGGVLNPDEVRRYHEATSGPMDENAVHSTATRAFNRMEAGSALLQQSFGDAAPRKLQYALAVANHIGQFGPEAQKVIGPVADRTAYRYRGTERAPDPRLTRAFEQLHRNPELRSAADRRTAAIDGIEETEGWNPGGVLRYFRSQLPDPDLNELQRRSGVIPPSEGVVIDRAGRIANQSVGYADDWYLPFNLKHLAALKGGEYIRTRSFGGPTTEDIYTGLVTGARHVTVVSHNGVFTIDFDDTLRGGRRFNDKAARMVGRYGHLLDALHSRQVARGGISPSRMEELRGKVAGVEPEIDSKEFNDELRREIARERKNPVLSKEERAQAAVDWLGAQATKQRTASGTPLRPDEYVAEVVDRAAKERMGQDRDRLSAANVPSGQALQMYRNSVLAGLQEGSPEENVRAIAALTGKQRDLDTFIANAEKQNARRVAVLSLDGEGYYDALTALKEQFPYYIAGVHYHPWSNAIGVDSKVGPRAQDTGYVAPRHNRPERAEAGYFNDQVTGHGKVRADTTRFQNYAVHQGHPVPVGGRRGEAEAKAKTTAAGSGSSLSDADAAELRNAADLAMLDELRSHTTFGPGAKYVAPNGTAIPMAGHRVETDAAQPGFPYADLKHLVTTPRHELESALRDPAQAADLRQKIAAVVERAERDKLFPLKSETVQAFRRGGRIEAPTAMPESTGAVLSELDKDHEITGAAYDPRRAPNREHIASAYKADPSINALRAKYKDALPGEIDADNFRDRATSLAAKLAVENGDQIRARQQGRPDHGAAARLHKDAVALARATQLRRRYEEARSNAPAAQSVPLRGDDAPDVRSEASVVFPGINAKDLANLSDDEAQRLKRFLDSVKVADEPDDRKRPPVIDA